MALVHRTGIDPNRFYGSFFTPPSVRAPRREEALWDQMGFPAGLQSRVPALHQHMRSLGTGGEPGQPNSATPFNMQPEDLLKLLVAFLLSAAQQNRQQSGQSGGRNLGSMGSPSFSNLQPASWNPSAGSLAQGRSAARHSRAGALDGSSVTGGPASKSSPGRSKVPPELARYGNGRIPASALEPIGVGNHRLYGPAAKAFKRMRADAAKEGVHLGVTDSYRSYAGQVSVARRKGLYKHGGLAAVPGRSKHGWGVAVDLKLNAKAQRWMRANAARYGFHENVPREPWHWEFHVASA